jgi:hypothetical protein
MVGPFSTHVTGWGAFKDVLVARTPARREDSGMGSRRALVVRGGWDGHVPVEATDLFIPFLEARGFSVEVSDTNEIYADADRRAATDLVVQSVTMSEISDKALAGLCTAIEGGPSNVRRQSLSPMSRHGEGFRCRRALARTRAMFIRDESAVSSIHGR